MTRFDKSTNQARILCIDPGLKCGWVLLEGAGMDLHDAKRGVWRLTMKTDEGAGMRWIRLAREIAAVRPTVIYYESTAYMGKFQDAVMVYSKIIGVIETFCAQYNVPYQGIGVGTIRKAIFGKGNLKKQFVPQMLADRYGILETDPDVADALAVAAYVLQVIARPIPSVI